MWRPAFRPAAVLVLGVALLLGLASAASAHVSVQPGTATQGGYGSLAFKVPNERDDANTIKLVVQLPSETPFASVSVKQHAGWTHKVTMVKLARPIESHGQQITEAVGQVEWSAATPEAGLKPGEFDEFVISVGPLPKVDQLVFKVLQEYTGGEVVRWIQDSVPGQEEPERPAPVLQLSPAAATKGTTAAVAPVTATPAATSTSSSLSTWISVVALLLSVGTAALVLVRRPARGHTTGVGD